MCDTEDTRRRQINKQQNKNKNKNKNKKDNQYRLHRIPTFIHRRIYLFHV